MTVDTFKKNILDTVRRLTLDESNWGCSDWQDLFPAITQEILNDAFAQHKTVQTIFASTALLAPRSAKTMARIEQKIQILPPEKASYYKILSDFVAVRLNCKLEEIANKIEVIRAIVLEKGGFLYIRRSWSSPDQPSFHNGKKFTDIIQFVYAYLPEVGYPIEFQIGSIFAAHTFTIDCALRDNPACGKVDLWTENFYERVRAYILEKANGQETTDSRDALQALAQKIHGDKQQEVPPELQSILLTL